MSRLIDDYDPKLVPKKPESREDDDGPPTRDLKPIRVGRHPAAKLDLDRAEDILDLPMTPRAPSS